MSRLSGRIAYEEWLEQVGTDLPIRKGTIPSQLVEVLESCPLVDRWCEDGDGWPEIVIVRDLFGDEWVLEYEGTEVVHCQRIGCWF